MHGLDDKQGKLQRGVYNHKVNMYSSEQQYLHVLIHSLDSIDLIEELYNKILDHSFVRNHSHHPIHAC